MDESGHISFEEFFPPEHESSCEQEEENSGEFPEYPFKVRLDSANFDPDCRSGHPECFGQTLDYNKVTASIVRGEDDEELASAVLTKRINQTIKQKNYWTTADGNFSMPAGVDPATDQWLIEVYLPAKSATDYKHFPISGGKPTFSLPSKACSGEKYELKVEGIVVSTSSIIEWSLGEQCEGVTIDPTDQAITTMTTSANLTQVQICTVTLTVTNMCSISTSTSKAIRLDPKPLPKMKIDHPDPEEDEELTEGVTYYHCVANTLKLTAKDSKAYDDTLQPDDVNFSTIVSYGWAVYFHSDMGDELVFTHSGREAKSIVFNQPVAPYPYKVYLTVTDSRGCSRTRFVPIKVVERPPLRITSVVPGQACSAYQFDLEIDPDPENPDEEISWAFYKKIINGSQVSYDPIAAAEGEGLSVTVPDVDEPTTYQFVVIRTSPTIECDSEAKYEISVVLPIARINNPSPVICSSQPVTLSGKASTGFKQENLVYEWELEDCDGGSVDSGTDVVKFFPPEIYATDSNMNCKISLTITDDCDRSSTTFTTIKVNPMPKLTLEYDPPCETQTIQIRAKLVDGTGTPPIAATAYSWFKWNFDLNRWEVVPFVNTAAISVALPNSGSIRYMATASDSRGCSGKSDPLTLDVDDLPGRPKIDELTASPPLTCPGSTFELSATLGEGGEGEIDVAWTGYRIPIPQPDGVNIGNPMSVTLPAGTPQDPLPFALPAQLVYKASAIDANQCRSAEKLVVVSVVADNLPANLGLVATPPVVEVNQESTISLNNPVDPANVECGEWRVDPGATISGNGCSATVSAPEEGTYGVSLRIKDPNCPTSPGKLLTTSFKVGQPVSANLSASPNPVCQFKPFTIFISIASDRPLKYRLTGPNYPDLEPLPWVQNPFVVTVVPPLEGEVPGQTFGEKVYTLHLYDPANPDFEYSKSITVTVIDGTPPPEFEIVDNGFFPGCAPYFKKLTTTLENPDDYTYNWVRLTWTPRVGGYRFLEQRGQSIRKYVRAIPPDTEEPAGFVGSPPFEHLPWSSYAVIVSKKNNPCAPSRTVYKELPYWDDTRIFNYSISGDSLSQLKGKVTGLACTTGMVVNWVGIGTVEFRMDQTIHQVPQPQESPAAGATAPFQPEDYASYFPNSSEGPPPHPFTLPPPPVPPAPPLPVPYEVLIKFLPDDGGIDERVDPASGPRGAWTKFTFGAAAAFAENLPNVPDVPEGANGVGDQFVVGANSAEGGINSMRASAINIAATIRFTGEQAMVMRDSSHLDISLPVIPVSFMKPVLYFAANGTDWMPVNNQRRAEDNTIAISLTQAGIYRVLAVSEITSFEFGEVYVYPNPAQSPKKPVLHVEVDADEVTARIYDISNELISEIRVDGNPMFANGKTTYEKELEVDRAGVFSGVVTAVKKGFETIRKKFSFTVVN